MCARTKVGPSSISFAPPISRYFLLPALGVAAPAPFCVGAEAFVFGFSCFGFLACPLPLLAMERSCLITLISCSGSSHKCRHQSALFGPAGAPLSRWSLAISPMANALSSRADFHRDEFRWVGEGVAYVRIWTATDTWGLRWPSVPVYFFDFIDGEVEFPDGEGTQCRDDHAARKEAAVALAEMIRAYLPGELPDRRIALNVRDGHGRAVVQVSLQFQVRGAV